MVRPRASGRCSVGPTFHSELQPALAGGVGQGLHPAVVLEAVAVERDLFDAGGLGLLGDVFADLRRGLDVAALLATFACTVLAEARVLPAKSSISWA